MSRTLIQQAAIIALVISAPVSAAPQLYNQWQDEQGQIHYADTVPPDQARHKRSRLDEYGYTVENIEGVKTRAEIRREKKLNRLRAEQNRLLAEQRGRDQALLRSFQSADELETPLQNKLSTLDIQIQITRSNIQQLKDKINLQQTQAAQYELKGKQVPRHLLEQIQASNKQMTHYRQKITALEKDKSRIRKKYEKDLERFMQLADRGRSRNSDSRADQATEAEALSLFTCTYRVNCEKAWKLARLYLAEHATTRLQIDTERLLYTEEPRRENDIALSVAKIADSSGRTQLFLDVRCRPSSLGRELCQGPKAVRIRSGFTHFLNTKL